MKLTFISTSFDFVPASIDRWPGLTHRWLQPIFALQAWNTCQQLKWLSQFFSLSRQTRPINVDQLLFMTILSEFLNNNGPSQVRRSRQAGLRCFWQGLPFWSSQTWGNNCYLSIIFLAYSSPPPSHSAGEDQDWDWSWVHLWWIFQHRQWESGRQSRDKIQGELGLKAFNVDGSDRELWYCEYSDMVIFVFKLNLTIFMWMLSLNWNAWLLVFILSPYNLYIINRWRTWAWPWLRSGAPTTPWTQPLTSPTSCFQGWRWVFVYRSSSTVVVK